MRHRIFSLFFFIFCLFQLPFCRKGQSQDKSIVVSNPEFEKKLGKIMNFTVPLMSVEELSNKKDDILLMDTREKEEFNVSHIPGAVYAGYSDFDISQFRDFPKDTTLVLYCSVGYRSEKIGEKLMSAGFTQVYNLYGSIFEWANRGYRLHNNDQQSTGTIHTYNRRWSRYVVNDSINKIH